jgi:hypothetical protein
MARTRKINVAPWYWEGFYRRGVLSHVLRSYYMRHIPMPCMKNPWLRAAFAQTVCSLSSSFLLVLACKAGEERAILHELNTNADTDKLKLVAPAGTITPFSCDSAIVEFVDLCGYAERSRQVFRKHVTVPFIKATLYELALLCMLLFFLFAPTWFVYSLMARKTTYAAAIFCVAACYTLALPTTLKLFKQATLGIDPRRRAS